MANCDDCFVPCGSFSSTKSDQYKNAGDRDYSVFVGQAGRTRSVALKTGNQLSSSTLVTSGHGKLSLNEGQLKT